MRNFFVFIFSFAFLRLFSQGNTPSTAETIVPAGSQTHALTKGKGVWIWNFQSDSAVLQGKPLTYSLVTGFTYWCKFTAKDAGDISFVIRSLDATKDFRGKLQVNYLDFMVYKFAGDGASLEKAIADSVITPCRMGDGGTLSGNMNLDGSGLAYFGTDTVAVGRYHSGFLKPLQPKPGEQYYLVVQILCPPNAPGCTLNYDNHFSLCFNNACIPLKVILSGIKVTSGKANLKSVSTTLDKTAALLKADTTLLLSIKGYSENSGDSTADSSAAAVRAEAAYNYLLAKGVDKKQITFKGYGSAKPVAPNVYEADRAINRRVELEYKRRPKK